MAYFQGRTVSFRECVHYTGNPPPNAKPPKGRAVNHFKHHLPKELVGFTVHGLRISGRGDTFLDTPIPEKTGMDQERMEPKHVFPPKRKPLRPKSYQLRVAFIIHNHPGPTDWKV